MTPDEVPAELVEKAARALRDEQCTGHDHGTDACPDRHCRDDRTLPFYRARVRPALAAVLPEIQAQARREAEQERDAARAEASEYLRMASSVSQSASRIVSSRAARLAATTEGPTP